MKIKSISTFLFLLLSMKIWGRWLDTRKRQQSYSWAYQWRSMRFQQKLNWSFWNDCDFYTAKHGAAKITPKLVGMPWKWRAMPSSVPGRGAWFRAGAKCSQSEARRTSFRQIGTYVKQLSNSLYVSKCISFYLWLSKKMTLVGGPSCRQPKCKGSKKWRKLWCSISMYALYYHSQVWCSSDSSKLSEIW
jgi:hypothetical protein